MKHKLSILFFLFFTLISSGYADIDRTPNYIVDRVYENYIKTGEGVYFEADFNPTLKIYFANNSQYQQLNIQNNDSFGVYSPTQNIISINIEAIYDFVKTNEHYNSTSTDIEKNVKLKLRNTFIHEIGHFLYSRIYLEEYYSAFNIEETDGLLQNRNYFRDLWYVQHPHFNPNITESDIPRILLYTIDFVSLYEQDSSYSPTQYAEETFARLFALCLSDNTNKVKYYDTLMISNYNICAEFNLDNRQPIYTFQAVTGTIVNGYLTFFEPDYQPSHSTYKVEETINSSFSVVDTIIGGIVTLFTDGKLIIFIIIAIMTSSLVLLIGIMYVALVNMIKPR